MKDLTKGNEGKLILMLALPMFGSNIVQQLYSLTDGVIVGQALGADAFAAVGNSFFVITLTLYLINAVCMGFNVLISQSFGAHETERVEKAIHTLLTFNLVAGVGVTVLGLLGMDVILTALNTPAEVYGMSKDYLTVSFLATIGVFGYNAVNAIFRSLGDSKTPFFLLIGCTILNVVLDLLFVLFFHWGVMGAAVATAIAQFLSYFLGLALFKRMYPDKAFRVFKFLLHGGTIKSALKIGVPNGVNQISQIVTMFALQSLINSYGVAPMTAYNAVNKIKEMTQFAIFSLGGAMSIFTGQNLGAENKPRIKRGLNYGVGIAIVLGGIIMAVTLIFNRQLVSIFLPPEDIAAVLPYTTAYYNIISYFYIVLAVLNVFGGVIVGAGATLYSMIASLVSFAGVQMGLTYLFSYLTHDVNQIWWALPIAWTVALTMYAVYYYKGKWYERGVDRLRSNRA